MNTWAQDLKPGKVVTYAGIRATVQRVLKNGVVIGFEGRGLREGEYVTRRVAAKNLSPWMENV